MLVYFICTVYGKVNQVNIFKRNNRNIQFPRHLFRALRSSNGFYLQVFFGYAGWVFYKYSMIISEERMTTVDLPKSIVFYTVIAAFAFMTLRAVQVFVQDLRRGYSPLERPEAFDGSEA